MPPDRVFKTLVADVDGQLTVAVVPVSGTLDLKALAAAAGGKKAAMADPAQAERASGYVTGGIAPIGLRRPLPVVVDEAALGVPNGLLQRGPARTGNRAGASRPGQAAGATAAPIARR